MHRAYAVPEFSSSEATPSDVEADLVAIPVFQEDRGGVASLNDATGGDVNAAFDAAEFRGKLCETLTVSPQGWRARRVLLVGMGARDDFNAERARRVGSCISIAARQQRRSRVAVAVSGWSELDSVVEGIVLGNYDNGHYKSASDTRFFTSHIELAGASDATSAIARGVRLGEAVNAARLMINEPGNRLTPRDFVAGGQAMLAIPHVTVDILDERRLEELGMGLLLGVSRGSAEPPRLLVARYEPPGSVQGGPVLGLVGKGVTFDTGGISIKPSDGMERMKDDMAGGAAVIAALRTIALEELPLRALAIVPATENMPSGTATKPGDVHRSAAGLTVEVNNTDAEGRLILGDALWYARQQGATHLIDVATLTGACIVALGKITTGLFATAEWTDVIVAAAGRAGEKVWPMPIFDEYRETLKSEIADMLNSPGRPGGAITAAMFLKEFVGNTPWAHLDIAGTAWAEDAKPWTAKGATGVMVRTMVEVARSAGKGWPS